MRVYEEPGFLRNWTQPADAGGRSHREEKGYCGGRSTGACSGRETISAPIYHLRHLNITYAIAAGVDPRTVADRAGHKDPGYLIRRYAHAVAAAQERALDVASNLLAKTGGLRR